MLQNLLVFSTRLVVYTRTSVAVSEKQQQSINTAHTNEKKMRGREKKSTHEQTTPYFRR